MKKLEEKIIKKVYRLETKKTAGYLFIRIIFGVLLILATSVLALSVIDILNEQSSFALLEFFMEDVEVIKRYFISNITDFFQELPQPLTLILLICIILVLVLLFLSVRNYKRVKNKLISLYKFYRK